jgi:hypothetical protein
MAPPISKEDLAQLINQPGFTTSSEASETSECENDSPKPPQPPIKATVLIVGSSEFYVMTNANIHFTREEQRIGHEKTCSIRQKQQLVRILCIGGMLMCFW